MQNLLRPTRPGDDGRHLPGGILHPMARRFVGGATNDESAGP
jgi:hypothetical protein